MAAGSRKRRRPDGRLASPPLAPSPLLTRNLQLLPVGLTQLPNDKLFVSRLRTDADDLLNAFAEAFLLTILTQTNQAGREGRASTSKTVVESDAYTQEPHVASPFSVFTHVWQRKGWHYVQFTFVDHADSKRAMGDAICRVLLEHLSPYVSQHTGDGAASTTISFANLKELFKIMAVPFALYMFWVTQIYPASGIGVKHCRPALEHVPIEQDYYDWLLDLPEAILEHLQDEERTRPHAETFTAGLVEVLCRLTGEPFDEDSLRHDAEQTQAPAFKPRKNACSNPRRSTKPPERLEQNTAAMTAHPDGIFDLIPDSKLGTRLPKIWPSVRVMSTLEANKEFGRVGNIVRYRLRETESETGEPTSTTFGGGAGEIKETVAGLSRGDVVRLKARQRLATASADLAKLLSPMDRTSAPTSVASASGSKTSDLITQTAQHSASTTSTSAKRARYEIETPAWITNSRYTAKLKSWLEESSTPMQPSIQRHADSKRRYREARLKAMPSSSQMADEAEVGTDFGEWVLQQFRAERKRRGGDREGDEDRQEDPEEPNLAKVDDEGSLSLESLYWLAAERTKTAAVERGELLKGGKGRPNRSK